MIVDKLEEMVVAAKGRPVILVNPNLMDRPSSNNMMQIRGRAVCCFSYIYMYVCMYVCMRSFAGNASLIALCYATGEEDFCRFLQRLLRPETAVPFVRRIYVPYIGMLFLIHIRCFYFSFHP